jgi:hypothetical protein
MTDISADNAPATQGDRASGLRAALDKTASVKN